MTTSCLRGGLQIRIALEDPSQVGECRRLAQRLALVHEFDETSAGRIGIVATELANNVIRHAQRGEFLIQALSEGPAVEIEMLSIDRGPGMEDVERCLRDGYSTAGTAGTGFGAIARLSGTFDVHSQPGTGTVALSRIGKSDSQRLRQPRTWGSHIRIGAISVPVRGETECGDSWCVAEHGRAMSVMVVDGLGHGPLAAVAAKTAIDTFLAYSTEAPAESMLRCHRSLSGTRGAAAACAVLDPDAARIRYAGVGNIAGSIGSSDKSRGMVSHNGTLGLKLLRAQQFEYDWIPGAIVTLHSDGLSARWSLASYPGLTMRHPAVVAAVLYRDFKRDHDDATVLVASVMQ